MLMIMNRRFLLVISLCLLFACNQEQIVPDPQTTEETHYWDANRGKVVTPSGKGWTSTAIKDGITYYVFSGLDELSDAKLTRRSVPNILSIPSVPLIMKK